MRTIDAVHLGLLLAALAITYVVPFELLLLSYVVLGPAHYFTEISWLHDRKYFLPHRNVAFGLAGVAVVAALIDNAAWFGFVIWMAFVACALLTATTAAQSAVLTIVALGAASSNPRCTASTVRIPIPTVRQRPTLSRHQYVGKS